MGWLLRRALFGAPVDAVTSNPFATATTPDDIICAAIIQSIAKDFDDWKLERIGGLTPDAAAKRRAEVFGYHDPNLCILVNRKKDIKVSFCLNDFEDRVVKGGKVNGVDMAIPRLNDIFQAYDKLKQERARLKRHAAAAVSRMEREEKAWNLAEHLLGMKRNEHGALVPVVEAEPVVVAPPVEERKRNARPSKGKREALSPIES